MTHLFLQPVGYGAAALALSLLACDSGGAPGRRGDAGTRDGAAEPRIDAATAARADGGREGDDGAVADRDARRPGLEDRGAALPAALPASLGRTFYVSPSDCADGGPGSMAEPWCTIQRALDVLTAGERAFVRAGTYRESPHFSGEGRPDAPISLIAFPGEQPVLTAQFQISGSWFRLSGMKLDGGYELDTTLLYLHGDAHDVEISHNELTRAGLTGSSRQDGNAIFSEETTSRVQILWNHVHHNGTREHFHHGLYLNGTDHLVANNLIANNRAYGLQLYPECSRALVVGNTIVGNGRSGVIIGSEGGPTHENLLANNVIAWNAWEGVATYWGGGRGSGNAARTNLVFANDMGGVSEDGLEVSDLVESDPLCVDPAGGDYRLSPGSPAIDRALAEYVLGPDLDGRARTVADADLGAYEY